MGFEYEYETSVFLFSSKNISIKSECLTLEDMIRYCTARLFSGAGDFRFFHCYY
jgi:hypothetical protein